MKTLILTLVLSLYSYFPLFSLVEGKSISDERRYREFCRLAASDEAVFATFRQHPIYCEILEHVTCEIGKEYLDLIIRNSLYLWDHLDKFKTSDEVGSPRTCYYPFVGKISPTTLRYIKILGDLLSYLDLNHKKILEIGAGYGGQCKIIADYCNFQEYVIIDLPEPLALIGKFLSRLGVAKTRLIAPENTTPEEFDVVISNYAFSECNRDLQDMYLENYLLRSKAGYMLLNDMREHLLPMPYSSEEIRDLFIQKGYTAELLPDLPYTAAANVLLIWIKN